MTSKEASAERPIAAVVARIADITKGQLLAESVPPSRFIGASLAGLR